MPVLSTLLASSVVALSVLLQTAAPVNAIATPAHAHAARNAITPNHHGALRRKRNSHKNRKRCVAQQTVNNSNNNNANYNSSPATTTAASSGNTQSSGSTGSVSAPACSGGKVGLGWGYDLPSNYISNAITWKTCYYYNWSSWAADSSFTGGLKFAPMFWGGNHIQDFSDNILNNYNANFGVVLGMNETNQSGQADIDPWTGASWWQQYVVPLRSRGYYTVSPSTTSAPDGITWMQNFMNALPDSAKPDAIALHWYGTDIEAFKSYVNLFASTFPGRKLWITEFACTDFSYQTSCPSVSDFARQAVAFLDANSAVEAYFPFGFVENTSGVQYDNVLMYGDGSLTDIGRIYLGLS